MKTRIGIVDDNATVRNRLRQRFEFAENIAIVCEAYSAQNFLDQYEQLDRAQRPQIVLMDIEMPGMSGIEATFIVKEKYPELEIIIQTVFEDDDKIFEAIQAGASGYLLKDDDISTYEEAISGVSKGGAPLSPGIARKVLRLMRNGGPTKTAQHYSNPKFDISKRELQILECIVDDMLENEIADKLFISPHTVHTHVKNIYKKLQVHSRTALVRMALENNLV